MGHETGMTPRALALFVHLLTATGAVFAMLAMLAAIDREWGSDTAFLTRGLEVSPDEIEALRDRFLE